LFLKELNKNESSTRAGKSNARVIDGIWRGILSRGQGTMSCRDTIHLICWYLEGRLSASVKGDVEQHLQHCENCHLVLEAAVSTLDEFFNPSRNCQANPTRQLT
jgi:hypothetical protein